MKIPICHWRQISTWHVKNKTPPDPDAVLTEGWDEHWHWREHWCLEIKSLDDLTELAKEYDVMFRNIDSVQYLYLDTRGCKFGQR